jgi:hypothetical protein
MEMDFDEEEQAVSEPEQVMEMDSDDVFYSFSDSL